MDTTRNLYEEALRRLTDSMVQMIEQNGRKRIGVCNPSINDFLKNYIRENPMEQANMPAYATEYVQLERICPGCVEELVRNGRIYQYHFRMLEAKRGKILELFAITAYGICVIWSSCRHSWRNRGAATPKKGDRSEEILFALLQEKMDVFYHTRAKLNRGDAGRFF